MDLMEFIPEQLLGIVAAIYVLGVGIKRTETIKNNYIPIILLGAGIMFSVGVQGISTTAIIQGVLCWGVAIGINQTGKQLNKEEK